MQAPSPKAAKTGQAVTEKPGPSQPAQSDPDFMRGGEGSSRTGADRDLGVVPVIGADRVADRGKPVAAQQVGEPALDPPDKAGPSNTSAV